MIGLRDWTLPLRGENTPPMPFSDYRDNFDPETLAILEAAFNEAWEVLMASGGDFEGHEKCPR